MIVVDDHLHARVDFCVQRLGGQIKAAMITGISKSTLHRWSQPGGPDVGVSGVVALAQAAKVSVDWLVTGRGSPDAAAAGYQAVPLFDVRLAAGVAAFAEAARVVADIPIDADLLRQLGRTNTEGLGFMTSDGDSMWPTIPDEARVLLDLRDTRIREGIFGFRLGNELRVKRLRRLVDGIEIISDNEHYPVERLDSERLDQFQVIGRALYVGTIL
jgi:phage repressor protein C with HTH and peptisase S24 domain